MYHPFNTQSSARSQTYVNSRIEMSEDEKVEIMKNIGARDSFNINSWFACPKGHMCYVGNVYCHTEGMLCPECSSVPNDANDVVNFYDEDHTLKLTARKLYLIMQF